MDGKHGSVREVLSGQCPWALVILAVGLLLTAAFPPGTSRAATAPVTFTSVSPIRVAAVSDYAWENRGYSWDFSDSSKFSPELTRGGFVDGGTVSGGWFSGVTAHGDA